MNWRSAANRRPAVRPPAPRALRQKLAERSNHRQKRRARGSGSGKAKRIAAAKVGMSEPTAEKAEEVLKEIDKAKAAGDKERAADLRETLNNESVAEAHRKATNENLVRNQETGPPVVNMLDERDEVVPRHLHGIFADRSKFKVALTQIRAIKSAMKALADAPGGSRIRFNTLQVDLDNARNHIRFAMPYTSCTYCDGHDKACGACRGQGWITESIFDQAPKDKAAAGEEQAEAAADKSNAKNPLRIADEAINLLGTIDRNDGLRLRRSRGCSIGLNFS